MLVIHRIGSPGGSTARWSARCCSWPCGSLTVDLSFLFTRGGTTQVPRFIHQLILIVMSIFVVLMYGKVGVRTGRSAIFSPVSAVVSIVIGLALQESLGNLFSGLVLQAAPPFVLGDFIQAGNLEGRVVDMTWRAVTLHTTDDNYVVIPNGSIAKQEIVNFHAPTEATARHGEDRVGMRSAAVRCDGGADQGREGRVWRKTAD